MTGKVYKLCRILRKSLGHQMGVFQHSISCKSFYEYALPTTFKISLQTDCSTYITFKKYQKYWVRVYLTGEVNRLVLSALNYMGNDFAALIFV